MACNSTLAFNNLSLPIFFCRVRVLLGKSAFHNDGEGKLIGKEFEQHSIPDMSLEREAAGANSSEKRMLYIHSVRLMQLCSTEKLSICNETGNIDSNGRYCIKIHGMVKSICMRFIGAALFIETLSHTKSFDRGMVEELVFPFYLDTEKLFINICYIIWNGGHHDNLDEKGTRSIYK